MITVHYNGEPVTIDSGYRPLVPSTNDPNYCDICGDIADLAYKEINGQGYQLCSACLEDQP